VSWTIEFILSSEKKKGIEGISDWWDVCVGERRKTTKDVLINGPVSHTGGLQLLRRPG
jgi:hypothetical protein